jgi:histidine phosphotransferase ChpT
MSQQTQPNDMELAALIASKVCHDVINPVGAINNGLEMLDEEDDPESREYALDMIRNVTSQATVRLKFARFAYGAAGSAGDSIDLRMAEEICREYVVKGGKHTLVWQGPAGYMVKDKVKLLLNLVSLGLSALLRGGELAVAIDQRPNHPGFLVRCRGQGARPPTHLMEFLSGHNVPPIDALTVQTYYTCRLAETAGIRVEVLKDGADIILSARSLHGPG